MHDRMIAPERLDESALRRAQDDLSPPADAGVGDGLLAGAPAPHPERPRPERQSKGEGRPAARVVVRQACGSAPIEVVLVARSGSQAVACVSPGRAIDLATELLTAARRAMAEGR